jgi:hypothetical protein
MKALEDPWKLGFGYASSRVDDAELHGVAPPCELDPD